MTATVDVLDVSLVLDMPTSNATVDVLDIRLDVAPGTGSTATVDVLDVWLDILGPGDPVNQQASVDVLDVALSIFPGGPPNAGKTGMYVYLGGVLTPIGTYSQ